MLRILAAAAIVLTMTSTAYSARLNLGCTDNPDLVYDPSSGNVMLVPNWGSEKNKIVGFVLANATGAFKPKPEEEFKDRTPWADVVYDNLPKQIGSSDIAGIGGAEGARVNLGEIFPTGLDIHGLLGLLSQADVLWKRGAGGKGALDLCLPEPSSSLLGLFGAVTLLAHRGRRRVSR